MSRVLTDLRGCRTRAFHQLKPLIGCAFHQSRIPLSLYACVLLSYVFFCRVAGEWNEFSLRLQLCTVILRRDPPSNLPNFVNLPLTAQLSFALIRLAS